NAHGDSPTQTNITHNSSEVSSYSFMVAIVVSPKAVMRKRLCQNCEDTALTVQPRLPRHY
ncbi:hypothetical protein BaRGS_00017655, partial [Batillaria attramentaria]